MDFSSLKRAISENRFRYGKENSKKDNKNNVKSIKDSKRENFKEGKDNRNKTDKLDANTKKCNSKWLECL